MHCTRKCIACILYQSVWVCVRSMYMRMCVTSSNLSRLRWRPHTFLHAVPMCMHMCDLFVNVCQDSDGVLIHCCIRTMHAFLGVTES